MLKNIVLKLLSVIIPVAILAGGIFTFGKNTDNNNNKEKNTPEISSSSVSEDSQQQKEKKPVTGVWLPYMSIDMSGTDRSEKAYTEKISEIFDNISGSGANTVIFQVRPFCDAIYHSEIFPASHIISGTQGISAAYDALEIAVKEAHKRNLFLHAWVNPLRVSLKSTPDQLSDDNPVMKWKNDGQKENDRYFFKSGDNTYLDPAYPEVRKMIVEGITEIVGNYDVDGIQIDDYFYPENDTSCDAYGYDKYVSEVKTEPLSHSEWRTENISILISDIYAKIHSVRTDCVFGISPQCNIENNYKIGADVKTWCSIRGYADYICPQIYVSESHPVLPFEKSLTEWLDMCSDYIDIYIGLAAYKVATDADSGTWLKCSDNLTKQALLSKKHGADGIIIYSYEQMFSDAAKEDAAGAVAVFG